jgi:hypothetical protein
MYERIYLKVKIWMDGKAENLAGWEDRGYITNYQDSNSNYHGSFDRKQCVGDNICDVLQISAQ